MTLLLLWLVIGGSVKESQVTLRSGCSDADDPVATLEKGAPVEIRFALSGDTRMCYKVSAQVGGKAVEGYLPQTAVAGSEEFDQARKSAPSLDRAIESQVNSIAKQISGPLIQGAVSPAVAKAVGLLQDKQPGEALRVAEAALRTSRRDPQLLAVAGIAAYRADDSRNALQYLKESLELNPDNPVLAQLRTQVERELAADRSGEKILGVKFVLRYDTAALEPEAARTMLAALDQEYSRISQQLGCWTEERIVTIVQSREAYLKTTGVEWSGGQYDGRIRVPVMERGSIPPSLRRTFAHEIVHACLSQLGAFPQWLQEGMAQKLSGDTLHASNLAMIRAAVRENRLPKLSGMGQDWRGLSSQNASLAYQYALAAVDVLWDAYRDYGVRNVLRDQARLDQVANEINRRLAE